MQGRALWWLVLLLLVAAAVVAIAKIFAEDQVGYEVPVSLFVAIACGAVALSGLALLDRPRLRLLAIALLLTAAATCVLLEVAVWDLRFAENHERVVGTTVIVAAAAALLGTLAAMIHEAPRPLRLITVAAATFIVVAAGYGIALVWVPDVPSRRQSRSAELFVVLALLGYFAAPVMQRALRRTPARGDADI